MSRSQPRGSLRTRQKKVAVMPFTIGEKAPMMMKLPPGPPVFGYGISRRIQWMPVSAHSVQSKLTLRWPSFSNTKPVSVWRMPNLAVESPSAIECDCLCR